MFKHHTNEGSSDDEKKYLLDEKPNVEKKDVDIMYVLLLLTKDCGLIWGGDGFDSWSRPCHR